MTLGTEGDAALYARGAIDHSLDSMRLWVTSVGDLAYVLIAFMKR
jgi:hypothetical protein